MTPIEIDSGENNDPSEAGNKDQTIKGTPEKQDIQEKQQEQQNYIPPSKPSPRPPINDRSMRITFFKPISQETPPVSHLLQFF
jgi:hypothetical protein